LVKEDDMTSGERNVIGVIPAAGTGTRISPLPGSKELFPIGFTHVSDRGKSYRLPKVVSQYLIESMITAGAERIYIILSDGKWDIFKYFGDGSRLGCYLAYLSVKDMRGMPYSINQVYPWVENSTVVFGMPDTIVEPEDAFVTLLDKYVETQADLTLGLFPTDTPSRFGMVDLGQSNEVLRIIDKPVETNLNYMWGIACWGVRFIELLNRNIENYSILGTDSNELLLGDFFQTAIDMGLCVNACIFEEGKYIDIGDPEELERAIVQFSQVS
jgi:glucose-1-phosphate thymidylyltransferase